MIDGYRFGVVRIDGKEYARDVIVFTGRVFEGWWREKGHLLQVADLDEVVKEKPEVVIVGTGERGRMDIAEDVPSYLESKGIGLIVLKTQEAVEAFNKLSRRKSAAAALHLTC